MTGTVVRFSVPPDRFSGWRFNAAETASPDDKLIGFRERRQIKGGGGDYKLFLLWQRITCGSAAECNAAENPNPALP